MRVQPTNVIRPLILATLGAVMALGASASFAQSSPSYEVRFPYQGLVAPSSTATPPENPDTGGSNGVTPSNPVTLSLASSVLPRAMVGTPYSFDFGPLLTIEGDDAPALSAIYWPEVTGLPPGLALTDTGVLTGTPTTKNETGASFEVVAQHGDAEGRRVFSIVVDEIPVSLVLASAMLPSATVGMPYSFDFKTVLDLTGGNPTPPLSAVSWEVVGGLPSGLSLDADTGVLSGAPDAPLAGAALQVRASYSGMTTTQSYALTATVSVVGNGSSRAGACSAGAVSGCGVFLKASAGDSSSYLSANSQTLYLKDPYRRGGHGNRFVSAGKWYAELTFNGASMTDHWFGVLDSAYGNSYPSMATSAGSKNVSVLVGTASAYSGTSFVGTVARPSVGDTLGLALNLTNNTLTIYRNCTPVITVPVPAGGVGYAPFAVMANSSGTTSVTLNAGQSQFTCPVPSGFNMGWW